MSDFETIIFEKRGSIAYVTLNRPQVHNAVNLQMRDDLYQAVNAVRDDPDVRVAVFSGAGDRAFSSGADISEFGTAPSYIAAKQARWERDLWGLFLSVTKPLIAAIQGYALGAGCEMSMCCDIRIASEDARLGLPEVTLGMIPAAGGTQLLPRTVLRGQALEIIYTGEAIDAQDAYRNGLVHKVVPRERLLSEAEAVAQKLAAMDPLAVRCAKEAIVRGLNLSLADGLALEKQLFLLTQLAGARQDKKS